MKFVFAVLSRCLVVASSAAEQRRANLLFLFADDQCFDTQSCAGHPIVQTPTVNHLAAEGGRFGNAHVTTPVCWVSRAVVLTGQWARSHAASHKVKATQ